MLFAVELGSLPLKPKQHIDGVSLVPLLIKRSITQRPLFWHYPHYGNQGGSPGGAIRLGDYKLIEFYEDNHVELYNLKDDISEKNDLSAKLPQKTKQLRQQLHAWRKQVGARMPKSKPD